MGFDKFEWVRVVAADRRLNVGERFVLTNAAIRYVRYGDDLLRVRQTTIADHFAVGVRTVRQSISRARQLGYLDLAQQRQRGRSYHGPDEHRLVIPADAAAITEEIPAQNDRNSGTERPEYRQDTTGIAAARNSLTSHNANPKGSLKGFLKGMGEGAGAGGGQAAATTPSSPLEQQNKPPSRYCSRHQPDGTDEPCGACGEARRRYEAWQEAAEQTETYERRFPEPLNHHDALHPYSWAEWTASNRIPRRRPDRFCPRHPHGGEPCDECDRQRRYCARWDEERELWAEWNADYLAAIESCRRCDHRGLITDEAEGMWWCEHTCPHCDEYGWRLGPDGAVTDPAIKCDHREGQQ